MSSSVELLLSCVVLKTIKAGALSDALCAPKTQHCFYGCICMIETGVHVW